MSRDNLTNPPLSSTDAMDEDVFRHYRFGIEPIDEEHRSLLSYLERIADAESDEDRSGLIDRLRGDLQSHFDTEIRLMRDIEFPYLATHLKHHIALTEAFADAGKRIRAEKMADSRWISKQIAKLLIDHVDQVDRQYAEWYREKVSGAN